MNDPLLLFFTFKVVSQRLQRSSATAAATARSLERSSDTSCTLVASTHALGSGMSSSHSTNLIPSSARASTNKHLDARAPTMVRLIISSFLLLFISYKWCVDIEDKMRFGAMHLFSKDIMVSQVDVASHKLILTFSYLRLFPHTNKG